MRSRQYLVEDVVRPLEGYQQAIVGLSCLDGDAQGRELRVLWETEVDAEIVQQTAWQKVAARGFDSPRLFAAYLNTLRWNLVTSTTPRLFQAPYRAGIEVQAYQLEPLRKALALPRVNLFIADDVGLGKTIEAGLIVRELLMRQKVRTIVVAAPPGVVQQWQDELEQRFGLSFAILDRQYVQTLRKERGHAINPWKTHTRFIISHALLRDEDYAAPLRDWLGASSPGTLLILDEAHNAAPASGSKYAIDSKLTRIVRDIARRFEHRLFLSATPHNGHSNSFAALLEILDPQRFCRGIPVKNNKTRDEVVIRRLKSDLRGLGVPGFPDRKIVPVVIDDLPQDTPELRLSVLLDEYRELREQRFKDQPKTSLSAVKLVGIALQQRLLSSVEAFACSLRAHRRGLERKAEPERRVDSKSRTFDLNAPGLDDEAGELSEDELRRGQDAAFEQATLFPQERIDTEPRELELLEEMTSLAEQARGEADAKVRYLVDWIREHMCPELPVPGQKTRGKPAAQWLDRRLLIFTEWIDTKRYVMERLSEAIASTDRADDRIGAFTGGMGDEAREEIKRAFNAPPSAHPLRILIATDAAREGVNLQNHCADLFHFDLPWNPSRLEQRNGRIDRKLQRSSEVRCHYFTYRQRPEDKVLETLVKKSKRIHEELGSLSQVIAERVDQRLARDGMLHRNVDKLSSEIESEDLEFEKRQTVTEELDGDRNRKDRTAAELEQVRTILDESQAALGFNELAFRDALSCSLELLGAAPLKYLGPGTSGKGSDRWHFPEQDERIVSDPAWNSTLDTLRAPRMREEQLWKWRQESPVRPIVFSEAGELQSETAHIHLEHRVAQRLLGRFLAQGFVHDEMSLASVIRVKDTVRRVVLLGKLCLYGTGASRLHEALIPVTARWLEPRLRKGKLGSYRSEAEAKTLEILFSSLSDPALHQVPKEITDSLRPHVAQDLVELFPLLEARAKERATRATELLTQRGKKEAAELVDILESQRKRITAEKKKYDDVPLLELMPQMEERRQLNADMKYWVERLGSLKAELETEPRRIIDAYEVKLIRVEPVGVVYLWPLSG